MKTKPEMNNTSYDSWTKFLNPETLQTNLICVGIFLSSYETLKDSIVDHIRSFYMDGFDKDGPTLSPKYEAEVLVLDAKRDVLRSSIAWLKQNQVINQNDERIFYELKKHRNELAHELPKFLSDSKRQVQLSKITDLVDLVVKIDRWWIINFELAIQDEIDPSQVDENKITSGRMLFLRLLLEIATGNQTANFYEEFVKRTAANQSTTSK